MNIDLHRSEKQEWNNTTVNAQWGTAWDRYLADRSDSGFMQSWTYANVLIGSDWDYFDAFLLSEQQDIRGGGRVYVDSINPQQEYFYIPDGPVLSSDPNIAEQQFKTLLQYIDSQRLQRNSLVTHLRIEPRWHIRPDFIGPEYEIDGWSEPRDTIYVDISAPDEQLLARMKQKGRYNIRVAKRHGVSILEDNSDSGINSFLDLYKLSMARQGVKPMSQDYLLRLFRAFEENGSASLFFAEYKQKRIVAALILYFADRATYFFTGSDKAYANVMAPYLMTWEIILNARQRGFRYYDMYGIAPPGQTDHRFSTFSRFKTMFGGTEINLVPTMDFIYSENEYRAYRASQIEQ